MRIAEINMVPVGSTGNIMFGIAEATRSKGHEMYTYTAKPYSRNNDIPFPDIKGNRYFGSRMENMIHYVLAQLTGLNGCFSFFGTRQLIHELKKNRIDILHLHNLHLFCINLPMLFRFIKKEKIKVIWTLHDCWTFTGKCSYFSMAKCDKWKKKCHNCTQLQNYPKSRIDNSRKMYVLKKKWFSGVNNMTIVTPSQWLANLVKESFLKDYSVKVINNGIDLNVFKPTPSDFRERYKISMDKYLILSVAFGWGERKGLDVFIELAKRLGNEYQIVLVGTDDKVDKQLTDNIISIHKTHNQKELAEIYTAADLFVIPTREDNFPTVNMESLACGTPVLTFKTGGSPEIADLTCGKVVNCDDVDAMENEIYRICTHKPYSVENCLRRAKGFNMNDRFMDYVKLYEE